MNVKNDIDRGGSYVLARRRVGNSECAFAFWSRENSLYAARNTLSLAAVQRIAKHSAAALRSIRKERFDLRRAARTHDSCPLDTVAHQNERRPELHSE